MWLFAWTTIPSKVFRWTQEYSKVFVGTTQVRPAWPTPPSYDYLCFTAEYYDCTVRLSSRWTPTSVQLEISYDNINWSDYYLVAWWGSTLIRLANAWDKVYFRNKSTTPTWFSTSNSDYYYFITRGGVSVSWDVNYLLCKNSTLTVPDYWFFWLFLGSWILTAPELPATTVWEYWYSCMFVWCDLIETAPELPATQLSEWCYKEMFEWCSALKTLPRLNVLNIPDDAYRLMFAECSQICISTTQTWSYQTPYRIPTSWIWTVGQDSLADMFNGTWWTFAWTPTENITYYTSNTVV